MFTFNVPQYLNLYYFPQKMLVRNQKDRETKINKKIICEKFNSKTSNM